jgi:outer membrane scaffolding protein for murein synthesis (MipA/OmpV family)
MAAPGVQHPGRFRDAAFARMSRVRRAAIACAALAAALAGIGPARAQEEAEPLWEAGIGVGAVDFPDYRGSSQSRAYVLPVPYFVYRGRFLQADRRGLRGVFMDTERVDLNLSFGASLPVESSRDRAREGMPNLSPTVEFGPSLELRLWQDEDRLARVDMRLPLRGAVTVERSPRFIGGEFFPHVNLDLLDPFGHAGWNLGLAAGPVFTDARYNRYFYEVPARFATAERPEYTPRGGFAGTQFLVALSKRYPKYWVGAFARYDTLRGARFEDSPLVTSKGYFALGFGISWIVGESSQRVPVTEFGERRR